MKKIITEVLGWYGTIAIVGAYALVSFSLIKSSSLLYQLLNITGSLGIVAISLNKKAYQPAVLNIIWAVIATIAIFSLLR
ncbi:MAG TPA: hypothetical protein VLB73_01935 [Patescibacteria group bacterium]|nr:hypothetical protein [Patescibacteria group bacterium]